MHLYKKYLFLSISLFFKLLINVFVIFYIAKMVSVSDFGSFSIAFIIASIATLCLDYGFNLKGLVLTRKTKDEVNEELSTMIFSKIIISGIIISGFGLFFLLSQYDVNTNKVIAILAVSAIPISFGNFYLNNFKIVDRFDKEAIGYIIQGSFLLTLFGLNHFYGSKNIIYYSIILLIVRVIYMIFGFFAFRKSFFKKVTFNFKKSLIAIRTATPYGVHLILGASIIYIDTFILSILSTLENVGLYQAGMRIIMASMLIAVIISDAFIPEISKIFKKRSIVSKKMSTLFEFVLLFSGLTLTTIFFYKKTIILLLFSQEYLILERFIVLILLIILLRYIGIVPGIILTSFGKQIIRARAVVISIIFSVILNVILIPTYGIKGAFLASLISHIILNTIYFFFAYKTINFTKNISFLLIIFSINYIVQLLVFSDSIMFLTITIFINIFQVGVYLKIKAKKPQKG
ncbi:oligosaccharide flippase family protein [Maribacter sp. ANRC-HE7]|uniref:Oligosaccharide flippase family protein n=1 Tax=Maribacter aquimaris TaxID=2737171 RepID=A0ABR7V4H7_9FLAO|nr:oligosaccharide flippase family protein [Maribacter aquimaris]MBD0779700.1 oligosaccharide flippase family protein [Maribacter aquimaris]